MTLRPWMIPIAFAPLLAVGLAAQAVLSPVPADWVSNTTLTVSDDNFSITAPAGWKWERGELQGGVSGKSTAFLAGNEDGTSKFVVVVSQISTTRFAQSDAQEFAKGMVKALPAGWNLAGDVQITDSAVPVAGSSLVRTRIVGPDKGELFIHFYMIPGRQSYYVMLYSPESTEPAQFTAFARSFHFIDPSKNVSRVDESSRVVIGFLFWWAVVAAIVDGRYVRRGGTKAGKKEKVVVLGAGILCLGLLVVLGMRGSPIDALADLTVLLSVVVLGSWQVRRFFVRRGHPVATQPPMTVGGPVWWKVIVGALLLYVEVRLILFPEEQVLHADNAMQAAGMWAGTVLFIALGIWLIYSGWKGKRRVANI